MALTGKTKYRRSFNGKMILVVEERRTYTCPHTFEEDPYFTWRDATFTDVQDLLELKNEFA